MGIRVNFRYDSTKESRPLPVLLIVCRPFLISSLEACASVSSSSVSLREVMGVTAFIISCVSTRVSLIQESISFSSSSLLMSFKARMRRCSLRTVMSLTRTDMFTVPRSLLKGICSLSPGRQLARRDERRGSMRFSWLTWVKTLRPSKRRASLFF